MAKKTTTPNGIVYSTEQGRMCPAYGKVMEHCMCHSSRTAPPGDGIVRVSRQTKGRKGKGVTLVTGLPLDSGSLTNLAKQLKQQCGSGGTVKDGIIEIQGDHRNVLLNELQKHGFTVKLSGG